MIRAAKLACSAHRSKTKCGPMPSGRTASLRMRSYGLLVCLKAVLAAAMVLKECTT